MSVEVVEKRKGAVVCGECGEELAATVSKADGCPECGSKKIKKSLVIVRKSVGDEDDNLEEPESEVEVDDEDEDDDEDDDLEPLELDDEDEEDEEEEDEEDEEGEEDDDDTSPEGVKKADIPLLGLETLNLATAFAEDIVKVFSGKGGESAYEEVMTEFNNVMDAAADKWFAGSTVSKADEKSGHTALIRERVNSICKEAVMPNRPKTLDGLELPDDVKSYIEELEGGSVSKREEDQYKGLPEAVVKSLKAADKIVEEREVEKWENVAKGYQNFPGDKKELAKTLRSLSEADPKAFEELKKTLDAAEYNLAQSDIFKSHGVPGGGEQSDEVSKRHNAAKELVSKGEYATIEQAEVALMDGSAYAPTVK